MGFTKRYETVRTGWRAVLCIREGLFQCERVFDFVKSLGLLRELVEMKALASQMKCSMDSQIFLA